MPSMPPVLLIDNVFDRVNQYQTATLGSSGDAAGSDLRFVADYRRERDYWQAVSAVAYNWVASDLGVSVTAPVDSLWLDRGHNLWGKSIQIAGDDGTGGSVVALTLSVPAYGTVGGSPTASTMCVTEEGTLWSLFTSLAARRRWIVYTVDNYQPIYTGIILGSRTQLINFSTKFDEDAAGRKLTTRDSDAGWRASDKSYPYATLEIALDTVGAVEYDNQIRYMKRLLFERNEPAVICMNYGMHPERTKLYQADMTAWSFATPKVYRKGSVTFRELGPLIR